MRTSAWLGVLLALIAVTARAGDAAWTTVNRPTGTATDGGKWRFITEPKQALADSKSALEKLVGAQLTGIVGKEDAAAIGKDLAGQLGDLLAAKGTLTNAELATALSADPGSALGLAAARKNVTNASTLNSMVAALRAAPVVAAVTDLGTKTSAATAAGPKTAATAGFCGKDHGDDKGGWHACQIEPTEFENDSTKAFTDAGVTLPSLSGSNVTPVKATLVRSYVHLGDKTSFAVPLYALTAYTPSVTTASASAANSNALLDPAQGVLNLGTEQTFKWRFGDFCDFRLLPGQCAVDLKAGMRLMRLASQGNNAQTTTTTASGTTVPNLLANTEGFGYYLLAQSVMLFPVTTDKVFDETKKDDSNLLGVKLGVAYFQQNTGTNNNLFPDTVGPNGKPLSIGHRYGAYLGALRFKSPWGVDFELGYSAATSGTHGALQVVRTLSLKYDIKNN